jgi:cytoskeletal protein RodZ
VDHADFGRYLAQQRELRGMSRGDVAAATRIPPTLILALEQGEKERLPERVFVLNYIRAYAAVIGLSPEEAVLRYEEIAGAAAEVAGPAELERTRKRKAWRTALVVAVVVAASVAAFVYLNAPGG